MNLSLLTGISFCHCKIEHSAHPPAFRLLQTMNLPSVLCPTRCTWCKRGAAAASGRVGTFLPACLLACLFANIFVGVRSLCKFIPQWPNVNEYKLTSRRYLCRVTTVIRIITRHVQLTGKGNLTRLIGQRDTRLRIWTGWAEGWMDIVYRDKLWRFCEFDQDFILACTCSCSSSSWQWPPKWCYDKDMSS